MRFVVFSASILSEFGYPQATSTRAVLQSLADAGHAVTHLEERNNRPLTDLLRARGSAALRSFGRIFPGISYRTYDLPSGRERHVWLGRELAIADAVIVLQGTPQTIIDDLASYDHPRLVRVNESGVGEGDLVVQTCSEINPDALHFGPAALRRPPLDRLYEFGVVAYDLQPAAHAVSGTEWRVDLTGVCGAGWEYLPEIELIDRYRQTGRVLISGHCDGTALVRLLTPIGAGCEVRMLPGTDQIANAIATSGTLPDRLSASAQAERLVNAVADVRATRGLRDL